MERLRVQARQSRAMVAHVLGMSSEHIRLIEKGKRTPAEAHMPQLLDIYHVNYTIEDRSVCFEDYVITFSSRIRAARLSNELLSQPSRNETMGQIVILLNAADDATLRDIRKLLLTRM